MNPFKKAERKKAKLRMALVGCSGSGKTKSALYLAKGIGGKIAVIDTERGSASLYSDVTEFDTLELNAPFTPQRYIDFIKAAEKAGYTTLIIDSLSHAWAGEGGLLEMVDKFTASSRSGNAFSTGWKHCTPEQNKLVGTILGVNLHIICCIRTKTAYELQTNEKGKLSPVKIGLAPVQRENIDYEFTLIFDIDHESHFAKVSKNRTSLFNDVPFLITAKTGEEILNWLNEGIDVVVPDTTDLDISKQDVIDRLSKSKNMDELKLAFVEATELAKKLNDEVFTRSIIDTKDRIKDSLEYSYDQRSNAPDVENYNEKHS